MGDERRHPERRYFVGDIQGCREELEQLLERVGFEPVRDRLRPVGDLVNRGPDNVGVLRLLRQLEARPVLGNHDLHLLGIVDGTRRLRPDDSVQDVLEADDRAELVDWLRDQPLLRVDRDLYQVHAGLHPAWRDPAAVLLPAGGAVDADAVRFATRARRCDSQGRTFEDLGGRESEDRGQALRPWFEFYRPSSHGGRRVIYGHWAERGLVDEAHVLGLDTGCVWGGRLTAWVAEEDRLVHVPATRLHCRPG